MMLSLPLLSVLLLATVIIARSRAGAPTGGPRSDTSTEGKPEHAVQHQVVLAVMAPCRQTGRPVPTMEQNRSRHR